MKQNHIEFLTDFKSQKTVTENFVKDIEGQFGEESSVKINGDISQFFKRMFDLNNEDLKSFDRHLELTNPPNYSLFGLGVHLSFFDHMFKLNLNGSPFMIVSQPYQVSLEVANKIKEFCDFFGAHLYIGHYDSGIHGGGSHLITISTKKYKENTAPWVCDDELHRSDLSGLNRIDWFK